jgi:hypothetical protein
MRTQGGKLVRRWDAYRALLVPAGTPEGWQLVLPRRLEDPLELSGGEALRALRGFLPRINVNGGKPDQISHTVGEVERLGSPERVLRDAAVELENMENMNRRYRWTGAKPGRIATGHPVIQLALEMAVNEAAERRALEGELSLLDREWR